MIGSTPRVSIATWQRSRAVSSGRADRSISQRRIKVYPFGGAESAFLPATTFGYMDTIRTLAQERHFFTAELQLRDFGQVLLIGDQAAVERLSQILSEHHEHGLVHLPDQLAREEAGFASDHRRRDSPSFAPAATFTEPFSATLNHDPSGPSE